MAALKIAVVMDPIEKVNVNTDTTFVVMLEAERRGHSLYYMEQDDLAIRGGAPEGRWRQVSVARATPHYQFADEGRGPLADFDTILMRKDPPFDDKYFYTTHLLSLIDPKRCIVMNDPHGLREATEKLYALRFPQLIPPSLVTGDIVLLKKFMDEQGGEMIVKPLEGAGGRGVLYLSRNDRNVGAILEIVTADGRAPVMAQRYLPEIRQGDKRVLVLDGEPIGALLRIPKDNDNRANLHVGGSSARGEVTERDREICRALAPGFKKLGLYFVGLDVIGGWLTEVNVTSPTCVQEIDGFDGVKLEEKIVDSIEKKAAARGRN
ncbi:MAG TPA: glutathione synthase [Verrucomicrobiae bacterium]|nr:glutathione synthase [Verrucomicrobiae bacterium]